MTAPARRDRLDELDALTDQIEPLLKHMAATWRQVELDLSGRRKQVTVCPTCEAILPNLLSDCSKPACLRSALNAEAMFKRGEDQ